ncbi:importin-5-like protein [Tanacetum coccineum]
MLRCNLGDFLRHKGCDDSLLRYKMLRRNPSGVLRRKVPWTHHFSAFLVQIPFNGGQEATAQEALELLIELTGSEPRFLRRQFEEMKRRGIRRRMRMKMQGHESSNYRVPQECLDRLAIFLGAGASCCTYCSCTNSYGMLQVCFMVSTVLNSFKDPHTRARWVAINAIGQLTTNLGPNLHVHFHQRPL